MIVRSKKTKKESHITAKVWEIMKKNGDYLNFNVVKKDEETFKPDPIPIPKVREFIKQQIEHQTKVTDIEQPEAPKEMPEPIKEEVKYKPTKYPKK